MRKISKLGASAMAFALSCALLSPVTVNAAIYDGNVDKTYSYEGTDEYEVYTNRDTKQSLSSKDYDSLDADDLSSVRKTQYISTNCYYSISLKTTIDANKITNFKSNKKALKVKVSRIDETTLDKATAAYDYESKDGKYYYRDVDGNVQSVDSYDKLPKRTSYGTYNVRLFTKTPGTYKLSYDVALTNGTTVKKTLKVVAKADGSAIKTITYAGQNVYLSANEALTKKYSYESVKGQQYDTTKKSGRLKVTMNDGFKLKKIEVGTPHLTTKTEKNGTTSVVRDYDVNKTEGSYYTWKTVKNGKKIKLSSVDESTLTDGTHKYTQKTNIRESKGLVATTVIRVTYFDKKNKTTKVARFTIDRLLGK